MTPPSATRCDLWLSTLVEVAPCMWCLLACTFSTAVFISVSPSIEQQLHWGSKVFAATAMSQQKKTQETQRETFSELYHEHITLLCCCHAQCRQIGCHTVCPESIYLSAFLEQPKEVPVLRVYQPDVKIKWQSKAQKSPSS